MGEYVFCVLKGHAKRNIKSGLRITEVEIDKIFNDFVSVLGNEEKCTPTYLRKKIPMFLMLQGCDLKEILVYFNMKFTAINDYVDKEDLEILFSNNIKRRTIMNFWEEVMEKCS